MTYEQVERIAQAMETPNALLVRVLGTLGVRRGEQPDCIAGMPIFSVHASRSSSPSPRWRASVSAATKRHAHRSVYDWPRRSCSHVESRWRRQSPSLGTVAVQERCQLRCDACRTSIARNADGLSSRVVVGVIGGG